MDATLSGQFLHYVMPRECILPHCQARDADPDLFSYCATVCDAAPVSKLLETYVAELSMKIVLALRIFTRNSHRPTASPCQALPPRRWHYVIRTLMTWNMETVSARFFPTCLCALPVCSYPTCLQLLPARPFPACLAQLFVVLAAWPS